jgi:hypothetical protein
VSGRRRIQPVEDVVAASVDDEMILLHVPSGIYYGLDAVGARTWQLLGEGVDEELLIEQLLSEYDVPPSRLRSDLGGFISELESKGLVRVVQL